ncbi:serine/threonine-protein kinase mos-like [Clytia hemisphaerica]
MPCSCRQQQRRARITSTSTNGSLRSLNSSQSSLPEEFDCSFSSDDVFYQNKTMTLQMGRLLGSGGFGSVFEGRCSGRKIAVKKLHHSQKNPKAIAESFHAERAVMSLKHRNIVRVLATTMHSNIFQSSSDRFVIMEYAGDRNLLSLLNDEKIRITRYDRLRYATDIANALHYIHKLNIVHLDIKPANIIVTIKNTCKLGDFGCCKMLPESGQGSPTTPTNSSLTGTLAYTSPELLKGEFPTSKADMYSYAICLWQLLSREKPYGNENMYVVIFGVVSYKLRPKITPKQQRDNKAYINLIRSLWAADPEQRPSAKQVMMKLRNLRKQPIKTVSIRNKERWRI